ncbi:class I SAM-dependent DNA methyltransferase [uncultured Sphingomonas sp.]|uniref:class I SAM-dependent DNA methyltransferase n=1 Tax=uncultured Sphingomonas sp. TaxID=158754 RepID=UPI0035CA473C
MSGRRERSIAPDYFERLYREKGDPWGFETSPYEAAKYDRTLAALPRSSYADALEVGCANGVLTARLAPRCDRLLAVDVSPTALAAARTRCADLPHVAFELRPMPGEAPAGTFDLILLSEVVYYLDGDDIARLAAWLTGSARPGGHLLLVHWTGETDYPRSGDDAVRELLGHLGDAVLVVQSDRRPEYRLDLWSRR